MTDSAGLQSIFQVFADVKRQVGPVGKNSENTQQHFKFRGVDAVVNAVATALDEHGVITVPMLDRYDFDGSVEVGQKRSLMGHAKVQVTYRFYGPAGDYFDAKVPGEAMDSGDKATAKAMSVAYRICLLQTLNLPTGDPDPDSQTYERSAARNGRSGSDFDNAAPAQPRNGARRQPAEERPERLPEVPAPAPLGPDDSWKLKIDEISGVEDADAAEAELKKAWEAGEIDDKRTHQIKHWIRVKAAPMRTAAQSARQGSGSAPTEPGSDESESWVSSFVVELAETPLEGLTALRGKLGRAVAERKITAEEASALAGEVIKRRRELEEGAAQTEAQEAAA